MCGYGAEGNVSFKINATVLVQKRYEGDINSSTYSCALIKLSVQQSTLYIDAIEHWIEYHAH